MIRLNMNPTFSTGASATFSAAFYALGYISAAVAFVWMARKRKLATQGMLATMGAGLLGGLLAANLVQIATGSPGKTVLGAVAGGLTLRIFSLDTVTKSRVWESYPVTMQVKSI